MKRIFMLMAVALMLVAAMSLSGVAQAAPISSKAAAQCLTLARQTLGSSFKPSNYAFHGGTAAGDTFTGTDGQSEVFCGLGGNDWIDTLQAGDIFLGGDGLDTVITNNGTFYGGDSNDTVAYNYGTFYGGADNDYVNINFYPGTYNGGDGFDYINNNLGILVDVP